MAPKPPVAVADSDQVQIRDGRKPQFYWVSHYVFKLKLSWRALLAYQALAHGTWNGVCKTSLGELAKSVGVSRNTIKRGIAELQQKKVVRIKQRVQKGAGRAGQMANEFTLIDPNDDAPI